MEILSKKRERGRKINESNGRTRGKREKESRRRGWIEVKIWKT